MWPDDSFPKRPRRGPPIDVLLLVAIIAVLGAAACVFLQGG